MVSAARRFQQVPGALEWMEERLNLLERLCRKYSNRPGCGTAAELETKLTRPTVLRESILEKLRLDAGGYQKKA